MDHRIGTCSACGARYRIPASFTPNQARCRTCSGVVEIGPVRDRPEPPRAGAAEVAAGVGGEIAPRVRGPARVEPVPAEPRAASGLAPESPARAPVTVAPAVSDSRHTPLEAPEPARESAPEPAPARRTAPPARPAGRASSPAGPAHAPSTHGTPAVRRRSALALGIAAVVLIGLAGTAWWWFAHGAPAEARAADRSGASGAVTKPAELGAKPSVELDPIPELNGSDATRAQLAGDPPLEGSTPAPDEGSAPGDTATEPAPPVFGPPAPDSAPSTPVEGDEKPAVPAQRGEAPAGPPADAPSERPPER